MPVIPHTVLAVCYSAVGCTGEVVATDLTAQDCCVSRNDGLSYSVNGTCVQHPCRGIMTTSNC